MGYCDLSLDGLSEEYREQWLNLILSSFSENLKLKILDIGTGTGFFPIILSQADHEVIGIDLSREAINLAICNAAQAEVSPKFFVMDGRTRPLFPAKALMRS